MRGTFETNIPNDLTMVFGIFYYYLLNLPLPKISIYPKFASLPKVSISQFHCRLSHGSASLPKISISQFYFYQNCKVRARLIVILRSVFNI